MFYKMLKSKIHRARVTYSNVDYEGSITLDPEFLEAAGILPYEAVSIYNITNGNRFETYTIVGKRGSGEVGVNGAAAHLAKKGDLIIIASYTYLAKEDAMIHKPLIVLLNPESNKIKNIS